MTIQKKSAVFIPSGLFLYAEVSSGFADLFPARVKSDETAARFRGPREVFWI